MLFFVTKLLEPLLWPLNLSMMFLFAGLLTWKRGRLGRNLSAGGFALLFLASLPIVGNSLRFRLESAYPSRPFAEYSHADAIVVLGGTMRDIRGPRWQVEEIGGSRLLSAVRLYRAGKADLVLVSGGVAYHGKGGEQRVEADDMRDLLVELGVPESHILRERDSRTTYENAVGCARLLREIRKKKILLVTSSLHIKRATALFSHQGLDVIPVPNSWEIVESPHDFFDLLPDAATLFGMTNWIKEFAGFWFYRLIGRA